MKVDGGGMTLNAWLDALGLERGTGVRWMAEGLLGVAPEQPGGIVNINGRLYIPTQEQDRFWTRAAAGEFAKVAGGVCKPGPKSKN
jgi:hypothetical protein